MHAPPVIVVGGQSRLGRAVVRALGGRALPVVRKPDTTAGSMIVPDYHALSSATLRGATGVINCAGLVEGSQAALDRANGDLPAHLARQSREAGVPRFIQVSSFAVYGGAETIDGRTAERPTSDYGRSKLRGDRAIALLSTRDFATVSLRIPLLFDATAEGKLAQLLRLAMRTGWAPAPAPPIERAMLGYEAAAIVAARLVETADRGIVLAADPVPFTYDLLVRCVEAATGRHLQRLPVPRSVSAILRVARPRLYASALQSSRLPDQVNFATAVRTEADLPAVITRIAQMMVSGSA